MPRSRQTKCPTQSSEDDDAISPKQWSRRTYLTAVGTAGLAAISGCSIQNTEVTDQDTENTDGPDSSITEKWRFDNGGRGSPAVAGNAVYVLGQDNTVYALDTADGTKQWTFQTGEADIEFRRPAYPSPTVADGMVYTGSLDGNVYALNASDGTEQWTFETENKVSSSPAVVDGTLYVGGEDSNVYALDVTDGTEQWSFETEDSIYSSPTVADGTIYISGFDGYVYALNAVDGTEQWRDKMGREMVSSPTVVDNTVYIGNNAGIVHALNTADGTVQWEHDVSLGHTEIEPSPAVLDGMVYIGTSDGSVYALDATDGTEQWHFEVEDAISSSPVAVNDTVYVGVSREADVEDVVEEVGDVYSLSAANGEIQWRFLKVSPVRTAPAVADGTVYVNAGSVYALPS
jgi:outer membrane protein assembly factor BamB